MKQVLLVSATALTLMGGAAFAQTSTETEPTAADCSNQLETGTAAADEKCPNPYYTDTDGASDMDADAPADDNNADTDDDSTDDSGDASDSGNNG
ncbi:hypothetical protein [Consotaella aegiceratis]|uniref:hypothetical protein n=1 Tax=Consotaella aegiceratis TaxID=3097961 RepID=UPI002F3F1BDF